MAKKRGTSHSKPRQTSRPSAGKALLKKVPKLQKIKPGRGRGK